MQGQQPNNGPPKEDGQDSSSHHESGSGDTTSPVVSSAFKLAQTRYRRRGNAPDRIDDLDELVVELLESRLLRRKCSFIEDGLEVQPAALHVIHFAEVAVETTDLAFELADPVFESTEELRVFNRLQQRLVVTDLGGELDPLFNQRDLSLEAVCVLHQLKLSSRTPVIQLLDGLSDCHFALGSRRELFQLVHLRQYDRGFLDEMAEREGVGIDAFNAQDVQQLIPVFALEALSDHQFIAGPGGLVVFD